MSQNFPQVIPHLSRIVRQRMPFGRGHEVPSLKEGYAPKLTGSLALRARIRLGQVIGRWKEAWRDALASAVAATLSWFLAHQFLAHPQPIFAAISAIVCLSPSLPSHRKQALGLMIGVATGIVVGELASFLPGIFPLLRLGLAAFLAILLSTAYGFPAVVPIQSGVSAILVLAFGPATAGGARMMDVAVGTIVGLFFSQVLLTPDPVGELDAAARNFQTNLAEGFRECAKAVRAQDQTQSAAGVRRLFAVHDDLVALGAGIVTARNIARWSLRGRLSDREVREIIARYDRHAIRLYSSALLFAESLADAIHKAEEPAPAGLSERLDRVAVRCAVLSGEQPLAVEAAACERPVIAEPTAQSWRTCIDRLSLVEQSLAAFEHAPPLPKAA